MATKLSASELFPDDILWFLRDMDHETIDEVDKLISQIEETADTQLLNSTQQADSASTVSDNFANVDSVKLKRLQDLNFNKNTKRSTPGSIGLSRGEVPWKLEDIPLPNFDEILQQFLLS